MTKGIILILTLIAFAICLDQPAAAGMQSSTYRIPTSVFSGGGAPISSTSYKTSSTLGQPSPLMDPYEPPISDVYDLYPGFWHVIAALENTCRGDFNGDKDVDGLDLADYLIDSGGLGLVDFAMDFGKATCP